jgi:hypothetical protein
MTLISFNPRATKQSECTMGGQTKQWNTWTRAEAGRERSGDGWSGGWGGYTSTAALAPIPAWRSIQWLVTRCMHAPIHSFVFFGQRDASSIRPVRTRVRTAVTAVAVQQYCATAIVSG